MTKENLNSESPETAQSTENNSAVSRRVFICKSGKVIALGALSHFVLGKKLSAMEKTIATKACNSCQPSCENCEILNICIGCDEQCNITCQKCESKCQTNCELSCQAKCESCQAACQQSCQTSGQLYGCDGVADL